MNEEQRARLAEWAAFEVPFTELEKELKPLFSADDWEEFTAHLALAYRFGFAAGWNELARRFDEGSGGALRTARLGNEWRNFDPESVDP